MIIAIVYSAKSKIATLISNRIKMLNFWWTNYNNQTKLKLTQRIQTIISEMVNAKIIKFWKYEMRKDTEIDWESNSIVNYTLIKKNQIT